MWGNNVQDQMFWTAFCECNDIANGKEGGGEGGLIIEYKMENKDDWKPEVSFRLIQIEDERQ